MVLRKYKAKDVDMAIAIATIVENAKLNQAFLQTKRSTFTMEFFNQLQLEIDAVVQQFLGADNAKQLRDSSTLLYASQKASLVLASEMKLQIELDFPDNKVEMLNNLGFSQFWKMAKDGDQESLINLLHQIKANLTPAIKAQMVANGSIEADINALIAKADETFSLDYSQETFKAQRPVKTEAEILRYNELYTKVMTVAKLATRFFKGDAVRKNLFSFSKIAKTVNASPSAQPVVQAT